jgi:hypothetical protein
MTQAAQAIYEMVQFFLPYCAEQSTMIELRDMAIVPERWREAHKLFRRIRDKTLRADAAHDRRLEFQYCFEEICAKTLYNMADHSAGFSREYLPPFDSDAPLWVMRNARGFAGFLGATDFDRLTAGYDAAFEIVAH